MAVLGSSVFCFAEPKCFRVRLGKGRRKGKQNKKPDIKMRIVKDTVTLLDEKATLMENTQREARKRNGKNKKKRFNQLCPELQVTLFYSDESF